MQLRAGAPSRFEHGGLGVFEQRLRTVAIIAEQGDADARAHRESGVAELDRGRERREVRRDERRQRLTIGKPRHGDRQQALAEAPCAVACVALPPGSAAPAASCPPPPAPPASGARSAPEATACAADAVQTRSPGTTAELPKFSKVITPVYFLCKVPI